MTQSPNIITENDADQRLDRWLRAHFPDSTLGQLHKLMRTGQIRIDGKRVKPADRLEVGMIVRLPPWLVIGEAAGGVEAFADTEEGSEEDTFEDDDNMEEDSEDDGDIVTAPRPAPTAIQRPARKANFSDADRTLIKSCILKETPDLLILNKPHGLASQGGSGTFRLLDGLLQALAAERGEVGTDGKSYRLIHRLDRDTSGVMLVAKTAASARMFSAALKDHKLQKTYLAITVGVPNPQEGVLKSRIAKRKISGQDQMVVVDYADKTGQYAETEYQVLDTLGTTLALVALRPVTGRTHQLRVHMEVLGTPILGDPRYGHRMELHALDRWAQNCEAVRSLGLEKPSLHLHAWYLEVPALFGSNTSGGKSQPAFSATAALSEHFAKTLDIAGMDLPRRPANLWKVD